LLICRKDTLRYRTAKRKRPRRWLQEIHLVKYVSFTSLWNGTSRVRQVGGPVHSTSAVVTESMGTADPFERACTHRDNRLLASKCLSVRKYQIGCYWADYREICF
jgi:hypothetical protein